MKKQLLFAILFIAAFSLHAQTTAIPDAAFEQRLIDLGYDTVIDGQVLTANINTVTAFTSTNLPIADLTGIEDFTALTNLELIGADVSSLNLSALTNLTDLTLNDNANLSQVSIAATSLNLTANNNVSSLTLFVNLVNTNHIINLTGNAYVFFTTNNNTLTLTITSGTITSFNISSNNLRNLDVSDIPSLTSVYLTTYNLESLDISNTNVSFLDTIYLSNLIDLDVSNTTISNLDLFNNPNISNLDVSSNTSLSYLNVNSANLSNLDVSSNINLSSLTVNNTNLSNLDLSTLSNLTDLTLTDNANLSQVSIAATSLNFTANNSVSSLTLFVNLLNTNHNIDLTGNAYVIFTTNLNTLIFTSGTITNFIVSSNNLLNLEVSDIPSLISVDLTAGNLEYLDLSNTNISNLDTNTLFNLINLDVSNTNISFLDLFSSPNLTNLDVSSNTSLSYLNVSNNNLSNLDVSSNPNLTSLNVFNTNLSALSVLSNSNLSTLQVISNANLSTLDVSNTILSSLDLSSNTNLSSLDVSSNANLSTLDASNTNLSSLDLGNTNLSTLDVSNTSLSTLYLSYKSNLSTLDVSSNPNLTSLDVSYTNLSSLDVSSNTSLSWLDVSSNANLSTLDVSNTNLSTLDVSSNNNLSTLYVSNANLSSLDVSNTNLSNLDVSSHTNLLNLFTINTNISSLDVSNNVNLIQLVAGNTNISSLDLSNNVNLTLLSVGNTNMLSLDVSNNLNLNYLELVGDQNITTVDLSNNPAFVELNITNSNITDIDLSNNPNLATLYAQNSALQNLNVKNGNNTNINIFNITNNPSLLCTEVDDVAYANANFTQKDAQTVYSTGCAATAFNFDGINDYAVALDPAVIDITSGTIEMRIKPKSKTTSQTILAYRNSTGGSTKYLFNLLANLSGIGFWNGSSFQTIPYTFMEDQWYDIVIIDDDSGSTTVSVNGATIGAFASEFGTATGTDLNLYVGVDFPLNEYFKGDIGDIRIWNTLLPNGSNTCNITPSQTGLLAHYNFNQGLDSANNTGEDTIIDNSTNTNNLLLTNTALAGTTSNWVNTDITLSLPSRLYVNLNATGLNNGDTWVDAFTSLQDAISVASGCNNITEIWVAAGTYIPSVHPREFDRNTLADVERLNTFHLVDGVAIYGGFNGTETTVNQRNLTLNKTILSGEIGDVNNTNDNIIHIVVSVNDTNAPILDGVTISDAFTILPFQVTLPAKTTSMLIESTEVIIEGVTINYIHGSGMLIINSNTIVKNTIITNNEAAQAQGSCGVYVGGNSNTLFDNVLIDGNKATDNGVAGILSLTSGNAVFNNITITNGLGDGGLAANSNTTINNSVFYNNENNDIAGTINGTNNYYQDGTANVGFTLLTQDPFVNSADPDGVDNIFGTTDDGLRPIPSSVLVDTGNSTNSSVTTDISGALRIQGNAIDVGAYEATRSVLNIKLFLQGALVNTTNGLMRDDLRTANYLPITSPYSDGLICNASIFNTGGTSGTGLEANDIVDWVFVELRDASNNTSVIYSTSALLQRNGDIVTLDGVSKLVFDFIDQDYFIAVKHRNHLGIISLNATTITHTTNVDFTNTTTPITFGTDAQTSFGLPANTLAMWAGDSNGDGRLNYFGASSDVPIIRSQVFNDPANSVFGGPAVASYPTLGYYGTDINMDSKTIYSGAASDILNIRNNTFNNPSNSVFGGPPTSTYIFTQQLPEGANN